MVFDDVQACVSQVLTYWQVCSVWLKLLIFEQVGLLGCGMRMVCVRIVFCKRFRELLDYSTFLCDLVRF